MYEQQEVVATLGRVAEGGAGYGLPTGNGLAQRADVEPTMAACGALHGAGLENPAEPASPCSGTSESAEDVAVVRTSGNPKLRHASSSCEAGGLAPLGAQSSVAGDAIHSEGETAVTDVRVDGAVSTQNVLQLLERQEYRCALTGRSLTPTTAALDHIVPIRLGGKHSIQNAQVLHKDVNRAKGSMTNAEFVAMCREVVRWADQTSKKETQR